MADSQPANQDSIPLLVAQFVDQQCEEFEQTWASGGQPAIEDYLAHAPAAARELLLRELLAIELERRSGQGAQPKQDAYLLRFLSDQELIRSVFTELVRTGPIQKGQSVRVTCSNGHTFRLSYRAEVGSGRCPTCHETVDLPDATIDTDRSSASISATDVRPVAEAVSPTDALNEPAVGQLRSLGRFQILGVLGKGAFGKVYKAHDPQLDRYVALKVPRLVEFEDPDDARRFLREARSAAQLRHPNIVPVYDAGRIEETYYIASAFVEGQTLQAVLEGGKQYSYRQAAALVEQIAAALHYAHNQGIIHRDIKPANIMLDRAGVPHLMDFGLARRDEGEALKTQEGVRLGTPAYMSPEQAKGESHLADSRSDLWSLGCFSTNCLPESDLSPATQSMSWRRCWIWNRLPCVK